MHADRFKRGNASPVRGRSAARPEAFRQMPVAHRRLAWFALGAVVLAALGDGLIEYPRATVALAAWVCGSDAPLPAGRGACESSFLLGRLLERYPIYLAGAAFAGFVLGAAWLARDVARARLERGHLSRELMHLAGLVVGLLAFGLLVSCSANATCAASLTCT
jgi:hypothetical protein